jgi:nitrate reductase NapA
VEINPDDASRLGITNGSNVKVSSRRGAVVMKANINGRGRPPQGMVFVPFFDESYLINEVTLDAFCPISKQPDYKKCAVKLERA